MSREPKNIAQDEWCNMNHPIEPANLLVFPLAVLEIKLNDEAPKWVEELITSGYIVSAERFSKFQHGIATFFGDKLPQYPHWWNNPVARTNAIYGKHWYTMKVPLTKPVISARHPVGRRINNPSKKKTSGYPNGSNLQKQSQQQNSKPNNKAKEFPSVRETANDLNENDIIVELDTETGSFTVHQSDSDSSNEYLDLQFVEIQPIKRLDKVEPKTLLASERVLLYWVFKLVFLAAGGLTLIGGLETSSKAAGGLLIAVSIIGLIYAVVLFHVRRSAIKKRLPTVSYDDRLGPIVLAPLILVMFCVAAYFANNNQPVFKKFSYI